MSTLIDIIAWVALAAFEIWIGIQIGYNRGYVAGMEKADEIWKENLKKHFDEQRKEQNDQATKEMDR